MGSLARFRQLSSSERLSFFQALLLFLPTELAIRVLGLRRWQGVLAYLLRAQPLPGDAASQAQSVARMVRAAARRVLFHPNCLCQGVVLWFLLRRRGLPGELRIGSCQREGELEAHAWVECAGVVLGDAEDVHLRYKAFERPIIPEGARLR